MKPLSTGTGLKDRLRQFDICLLICTSVLSIMSLLLRYSISDTLGFGLLRMQAASTLVGVFVMVFLATVDYQEVVNKLWVIFLIGEIGLLGITVVFGIAEGENQSWLEIGPITIQPSEFVKGTFIVTFSKHLDIVKHKINHPLSLLGLGVHAGAIIGLILISGDLGVALVYCGIVALMLFCAGLSLFYFLGAGVAAFVAIPYAWDFLKEYQKKRIIYGFNPEADPEDTGYQALLGRDALANGGFFGQGINGGTYYKGLFACENDFACLRIIGSDLSCHNRYSSFYDSENVKKGQRSFSLHWCCGGNRCADDRKCRYVPCNASRHRNYASFHKLRRFLDTCDVSLARYGALGKNPPRQV